jgi:hypothetical protein
MDYVRPLAAISDDELLRRLADLLRQSRRVESDLIAHIAEVDERRLYAREASPSMFAYCTEVLHLSEAEAYLRITVARASREYQIEELIAEIAPRPDAPAVMRRLPEGRVPHAPVVAIGVGEAGLTMPELRPDGVGLGPLQPGPGGDGGSSTPALGMREVDQEAVTDPFPTPAAVHPPAVVQAPAISQAASAVVQASLPALIQPLGAARYKVQFTASAELRDKLERLRALMRSQVPDGDLATIIERAVTEKLERLEARRFATTSRPRKSLSESATAPSSRHIPAAVRRAVYERDAGRCRYVDESGRRCSERDRLEYHHRHPFAAGGDHSQSNTRLMCRGHNAYLAEHDYGREAMARYRRSVARGRGDRTRPVDRAGGDPGGHESLNQTRTPTYIVPA